MKWMKCFLVLLLMVSLAPIQSQAVVEKTSIIIQVEGDPYEHKEYIERYHPFVEVIQVYDTLLSGLALEGKVHQIERLKREDFIVEVHPVSTYQVHINDSVPFILQHDRESFSKLSEFYTGKGVKVGVIDTGIDYDHPDLRRNYRGGYDLVDLDLDPMETKSDQGAPTMHGTHVSGIIAANGSMKGVAPDAELYGYRALGPGGMGSSIQVIAAIEQAVEDGMDIINLSLGNTINGPDWPTSIAVNTAVDMGVATVISNGNSGPNNWTVGSPATAVNAISVGATSPPLTLPYLHDSFGKRDITLTPMMGSDPWKLTKKYGVAFGGLGKEALPDMNGKIALLERGEISFTEKAVAAEKAGAVAALIYNNEQGSFAGSLTKQMSIPIASISQEDGEWLKESVIPEDRWIETNYRETQDDLAAFSSKGPVTVNWDIKPDIVAPGVAITSTVPGGYMDMQGTSMSAPHVAGALALIKEAHPDWGVKKLKAALLTTAEPIKRNGEYLEPIAQGMGRISPIDAIQTKTIIYDGRLTFGRIMEKDEKRTVHLTIENISDEEQTFSFKYPNRSNGMVWELPLSFSIPPNSKKTIPVKLSIDTDRMEEGLHQGWLQLETKGKDYQLPYLFVSRTADFPRVMGLEFSLMAFKHDLYQYRLYLPDGAEKLVVELYNPDTLRFVRTLITEEDVKRGTFEGTLSVDEAGEEGYYLALVKMIKDETYSSYQSPLYIGKEIP